MSINDDIAKQRRRAYGPWAVVTGASDGIGRALALALADQGFNLVLAARRATALHELAAQLATRGVMTSVVAVDLSTPKGCHALAAATEDHDVGLLIAAAGFGTSGPFMTVNADSEAEMLAVNCGAVLSLTHVFARRFATRGRGGIIMMGSLLAFQGVPGAATYAATKAFVQTLGEGLHREFKPAGVDVLVAAPGPVKTGFAARAHLNMGFALSPDVLPEPILAALGRRITVRPGWLSWLLEAAFLGQSRGLRSLILSRVMAGMTQHQRGVT
ncbi:MAG: SDR family NAD(P)-dependent oxidoreductase [Niveispirillum sp.]|nr:SDR family NAD(P)-dependent oxidoreductase [Niveispirillum sp.]